MGSEEIKRQRNKRSIRKEEESGKCGYVKINGAGVGETARRRPGNKAVSRGKKQPEEDKGIKAASRGKNSRKAAETKLQDKESV